MNRKIGDIEFLRGVAVLLVVVHHADGNLYIQAPESISRFYNYFGGDAGVDLFFAISGFVIARDLLPKLYSSKNSNETLNISLAFWTRRAWRLLPTAWLWLLISLILVISFNTSGAFGSFRANYEATISAVLHVANLRFAETFGVREYGVSFPYWSLSLEEQFYLIFPIMAILCKRTLPYALAVVVLLQLLSTRSSYLMVLRTDAIALGVLLSIYANHPFYCQLKPRFLASKATGNAFILFMLVCMVSLNAKGLNVVSLKQGLIAAIAASLVWIASYDANYIFTNTLARRLMMWVGARSYAIYVIHIPAFLLTREIWFVIFGTQTPGSGAQFYIFSLTAVFLLLFFSEINFRFIENPLRKKGNEISSRLYSKNSYQDIST